MISMYAGNPIKRVSAEIENGMNQFNARVKQSLFNNIFARNPDNKSDVPFNIPEFIRLLTSEVNVQMEVKAFLMAYVGSIDNVIPAEMVIIDFDSFVKIFVDVSLQCDFDVAKISFK